MITTATFSETLGPELLSPENSSDEEPVLCDSTFQFDNIRAHCLNAGC